MDTGKSSALRSGFRSRLTGRPDMIENLGKLPPQATDLEEAVLGALMLEKDALTTVIDILKAESFYRENHKEIYKAIVQLFNNSEPVDLLTVTNQLRKNGKLEFVGGAYYITELTTRVNSAANIEFHARIISEQSIKRELIRIASEIQHDAYEDTTDVFNLLDRTEQALFEVSESNIRKNYSDMRTIMAEAIAELEAKKDHKDGLTGIPSGFTLLDRVTSGWQKSDLVIIAARPGMGKCLGKGTKVLMFDGNLRKVEDVKAGELLMGDNSTARKVFSIGRGKEKMYWIHQDHGVSYRVNESHILSLKLDKGVYKDEVVNITVKEYLDQSESFKKRCKGYKVAVEFEEMELIVSPYELGFNIGEGRTENFTFTLNTNEVANYFQNAFLNFNVKSTVDHQNIKSARLEFIQNGRGYKDHYSFKEDQNFPDLHVNHIPQEYLINSSQNRMELLAGIIDAHGLYKKQDHNYKIVQNNERLASQIKFLCDSLGFRTSLRIERPTIAGTTIAKEYYHILIFGDLNRIPVRLLEKKAEKLPYSNEWRKTKINVVYDCIDDYYGFEIDGNRLFLLEDMTVTHNTAFVVSAMRNAAVEFNHGVAIFSLEMSSIQLVNRLISAEAELESEKIKKGKLADYEWQQLVHKTDKLTSAPIFIDDTPALSILELRAKCRRLKSQHNIQLVIIDYLQLMSGDSSKGGGGGGNREQEIASISRALKNIAKELSIPVIALSQLSRAVETRGGDKRPQLSDLRESGSIEQDADMVMFLYRPEYYGITEDEKGNSTQNVGEVIIAKHRNGSLDTVPLKFIGKFTKFCDLDSYGGGLNANYGHAFPVAGVPREFDSGSNRITLGSKLNKSKDDSGSGSSSLNHNLSDDSDEPPF
jgi:replicative DNA helicase